MSPAVRNYLSLKRRYRALLEERSELLAEIRNAEAVLADIEAGFSIVERNEWRALDAQKEATL